MATKKKIEEICGKCGRTGGVRHEAGGARCAERLEEVGAREVQEEGVEAVKKRQKKEKSGRKRGANDSEEEDVEMPAPKRMGSSELSLSDRLFLVEESGEPDNVDEKMLDASSNVEGGQYKRSTFSTGGNSSGFIGV